MSVQKKHSDLFSVPLSEMLLTLSPGDVADEYDDLIKDIDWRLTPPYVCQWAAVPETAKQSLLKDIKASLNRHHIRESAIAVVREILEEHLEQEYPARGEGGT